MPAVRLMTSERAGGGVARAAARVRAALALTDLDVAEEHAADAVTLVVDPAPWHAGAASPPRADALAASVALSLAPYGSDALLEDAAVGRHLAAIGHHDERCVRHLAVLGCRAVHVPLGVLAPSHAPGGERRAGLLTAGGASHRRLNLLANGAAWLDAVTCAHRIVDHRDTEPGLADAHVLLDLADEDHPAPDLELLLAAAEAGTAVVTERLGAWPADLPPGVVIQAPVETAFLRARELAEDSERAAAQASRAYTALAEALPLQGMADALAALVAHARADAAAAPAPLPVALSHPAAAPTLPPTVREVIHAEQQKPDAMLREGVQQALASLRALSGRVERLEAGGDDGAQETVTVRRAELPAPPLVTVLVPAHNAHLTLPATLDSVLASAQEPDAPAVEVIVIDDASPGPDADTAVAWADAHPALPVTVLRHARNRGLSAARNTAAAQAAGPYVLPLDADDLLRPRGLVKLVAALDGDADAAFAYGILQRFDTSGPTSLVGVHPWAPERLRTGNFVPALALIRRDALDAVGGYHDMRWGFEDWDLWCRFAEVGRHGTWVPEIVASYRTRANSMSAGLHLSLIGPLADMVERHPALLG